MIITYIDLKLIINKEYKICLAIYCIYIQTSNFMNYNI